jgi:transcriptional regulator with GAF, ATPase, and Fis domain
VDRALILSRGKPLVFDDIGDAVINIAKTTPPVNNEEMSALDCVISNHIIRALETAGGRVGGERGAAKLLKMNPSTLRTKMKKLGISFGRKKSS